VNSGSENRALAQVTLGPDIENHWDCGSLFRCIPCCQTATVKALNCVTEVYTNVYCSSQAVCLLHMSAGLYCRKVPRVKSEEESRKSWRVLNAGLRAPQTAAM